MCQTQELLAEIPRSPHMQDKVGKRRPVVFPDTRDTTQHIACRKSHASQNLRTRGETCRMPHRRDFGNICHHKGRPGVYVRFSFRGIRFMRYAGPTREEAKKKLSTIHALLSANVAMQDVLGEVFGDPCGARLTVRDAIAPYLEYAKSRKKASTMLTDHRHFKVIVKASWTAMFLPYVRVEDIERWVDRRLKEGASPPTVNRQVSLCSALYRWALKMSYVQDNPFRRVERLSEKGRSRKIFLTVEEARALVAAAEPFFVPFLVAALSTGMRFGELITLEWSSVCLTSSALVVQPDLEKTGRGRTVPLTEDLHQALAALNEKPKVTPVGSSNVVFRRANGRPLTYAVVRGALRRTLKRCATIPEAKKKHVTLHVLRHTASTLFAADGMPNAYVTKTVGNTTPVNLNYTHIVPEAQRAAIIKAGRAFGLLQPSPGEGRTG